MLNLLLNLIIVMSLKQCFCGGSDRFYALSNKKLDKSELWKLQMLKIVSTFIMIFLNFYHNSPKHNKSKLFVYN